MENEKKTGYVIYDFMKESMGLSGVALRVYALIYSFTNAGGDCHASIKNIAKRVDATPTSVKRAIKDLIEQDYIIKTTNNQSTANHYMANRGVHHVPGEVHNVPGEVHHVPGGGTSCSPGGYISDPNNKDNNKTNNSNNTHTFIQGTLTRGKNQPIVPIGPKRVVHMTLHQYANLLRAFGVHGAVGYVKRMEKMILVGGDFFGDHFKTIVGWARKDGLVTPEAEEILIN